MSKVPSKDNSKYGFVKLDDTRRGEIGELGALDFKSTTDGSEIRYLGNSTTSGAAPNSRLLDFDRNVKYFLRLKKGAPVGQMTRNFYTQELGVLKNSKEFVKNTQAEHLNEVSSL